MGRLRRREAFGLEVKELPLDRLIFTLSGVVERGLGALKGGLRIHHPPTLGHPVVAQLKTLIAGVVIKTMPTVQREGLRDCLWTEPNGVGDAGDQAEVAEVGGVIFVVQFQVGDQIAWVGGQC